MEILRKLYSIALVALGVVISPLIVAKVYFKVQRTIEASCRGNCTSD